MSSINVVIVKLGVTLQSLPPMQLGKLMQLFNFSIFDDQMCVNRLIIDNQIFI